MVLDGWVMLFGQIHFHNVHLLSYNYACKYSKVQPVPMLYPGCIQIIYLKLMPFLTPVPVFTLHHDFKARSIGSLYVK